MPKPIAEAHLVAHFSGRLSRWHHWLQTTRVFNFGLRSHSQLLQYLRLEGLQQSSKKNRCWVHKVAERYEFAGPLGAMHETGKKRDWTSEVLSKFSRGQTVKMRVYFPVESVYILTKQGTPSNSGTSSQATSIHRCRNTLLIPSAFWHTVAFMLLSDICLNDQPSSPHLQLASIPCTLAPSMVQFFLERFCPATRTLSKLSSGAFVILGANDASVYLCHEVLTDQGALWKWLKMSGWNTASELLQQRYASLGVQIALAIKELAAFLPFRYCLEREREIHLDLFVQIHLQWGGSQLGRSPKSELLTSNWGSNNHTRQCQKWPCSSRRVSWVHKVFQWLSAVLWFLWRLAINWQNGTN